MRKLVFCVSESIHFILHNNPYLEIPVTTKTTAALEGKNENRPEAKFDLTPLFPRQKRKRESKQVGDVFVSLLFSRYIRSNHLNVTLFLSFPNGPVPPYAALTCFAGQKISQIEQCPSECILA